MHAVLVRDDRLIWSEVPDPAAAPGEAIVEVHATALNRADLAQRAGRYPPPPGASEILGLEMAGRVLEAPEGSGWRPGDRVCALLAGGGYAERVAVPAAMLMPVPRGWSLAEAAALPEAAFTAFLNVFVEGGLEPGGRLLVHGGASGVGTAAIAQAVEAGAAVYATASAAKLDACRELGAALAVDYRAEDFAAAVRARLDGEGAEGVDVILDPVGGPYLERNVGLLATGGRLTIIATMGGRAAELDLRALMARRASVKGSTLRARPLEEKVRLRDAFLERFGPALDAGRLRPAIDRVVPIAGVEAAHEAMRANATVGKVVLEVRPGASDGRGGRSGTGRARAGER